MARLIYTPVPHDHEAFLKKAGKKPSFKKSYDELEQEYTLAAEKLASHVHAILTKEPDTTCDKSHQMS